MRTDVTAQILRSLALSQAGKQVSAAAGAANAYRTANRCAQGFQMTDFVVGNAWG